MSFQLDIDLARVLFACEQPWMFPIRNLKNIGHGVVELSLEMRNEYLIA